MLSAYISPQGSATTTPLLLGSPSDTSLLALFRSPALSHTHYPSPAHTLFDTPEHAELELANSWQSPFSGSDILSGAVSQTGQNAQTSAPGQLKRPYSSPNISDGQATKRRLNAVGIASGIGPEAVGGGTGFELAGVNVGRGQLKRCVDVCGIHLLLTTHNLLNFDLLLPSVHPCADNGLLFINFATGYGLLICASIQY